MRIIANTFAARPAGGASRAVLILFVSAARRAAMLAMLSAASGLVLNNCVNPSRLIYSTSTSVAARTVALRGSPVSSAVSPKKFSGDASLNRNRDSAAPARHPRLSQP